MLSEHPIKKLYTKRLLFGHCSTYIAASVLKLHARR